MNEKDLDALIRDACTTLGINRYHTHDSRRSTPGFPDLVLWSRGGMLFRELKSDLGRISRTQIAVRDTLHTTPCVFCGHQLDVNTSYPGCHYGHEGAYIWRPDDWHNGRIHTELRQISRTWKP